MLIAQEDIDLKSEPIEQFNHSLKLGIGFPFVVGNSKFNKIFDGTYHFAGSLDFRIYKDICLGIYGDYSQFDNGTLRVRTDITKNQTLNTGVRLSFEKYISSNAFVSVGIDGGYSMINYKTDYAQSDSSKHLSELTTFSGGVIGGLGFLVEGKKAFMIHTKYHVIQDKFTPQYLNQSGDGSKNYTQYLTLLLSFVQGF